MIYNTIHHDIRNAAGLTLLEWCLLESIYKLSKSEKAKYTGWCNAARKHFLYLSSEATIKRALLKLSAGDNPWIEYKDEKRRLLKRTTARYYNSVMCYLDGTATFTPGQNDPLPKTTRVKTTRPPGQNDPPTRVKMTPNNNKDNNKDNSIPTPPQKSNLKLYEMTLKTFTTPAAWDADTAEAFHLWCDNMHTIRKGRWGGLSHITELVRLINQQIKTYGNKKTTAAMRAAAVKGGHSFHAKWEQEKEQKQNIKPGQSGQAIKYSFNRKTTNF